MKTKLLFLFVALIATTALWASNVITYTATKKLSETTETYDEGLHTNAFNVSISSHTFSNGTGTITFAGEVTSIGRSAFWDCTGLTSVTIPSSVTTIGEEAFFWCDDLTSITIPNSVKTIGNSAFYGCSGLTSVTIPNSVTTIRESAFAYCTGLTSITIPNSVKTIGNSAFEDVLNIVYSGTATWSYYEYWGAKCMNGYVDGYLVYSDATKTTLCGCLCDVTGAISIPSSVTTIRERAFEDCMGLTKTNYTGTIADWCKIKFGSKYANPMYYSHNFYINDVEIKDLVIPNGVDTIGSYAFYYCSGLTSVTIPNSVTTIGDYAFYDCSGLTSVTIPSSVTTIGESAFLNCTGLTSVTINSNAICSKTYSSSSNIGNIFGSRVKEYIIGDSVNTIGSSAFYGCRSLTSVTIPNSVTTIGSYAFDGCSGIKSVIWNAKNSNGYNFGKQVETFVFGNSVQVIPNNICSGMTKLNSITIPSSVKTIGNDAFNGCSGLTSVTIPSSVATIGNSAFSGCNKITNLIFGSNLTTIGNSAFANCNRIDTMTIYAVEPPAITETTFKNVSRYAFLYVPQSSERKYKTDAYWSYFDIQTISAKNASISGDEVVVLPSTDNATFTWPANPSADGYSLEITKDGVVFCTLKFNANGQLTSIAFAPSRSETHAMPAATMTSNGWQFTVTGLDQASKYAYTLDVTDAGKQVIKSYKGEFATDGYTDLLTLPYEGKDGIGSFKFIQNGQLYILRDGKTYMMQGTEIK